jgi:hypothetical protein
VTRPAFDPVFDALALEYQRDYGTARGHLDLADVVNPIASYVIERPWPPREFIVPTRGSRMITTRDQLVAEARRRAHEIAFEHDWTDTASSRRELHRMVEVAIIEAVETAWPDLRLNSVTESASVA